MQEPRGTDPGSDLQEFLLCVRGLVNHRRQNRALLFHLRHLVLQAIRKLTGYVCCWSLGSLLRSLRALKRFISVLSKSGSYVYKDVLHVVRYFKNLTLRPSFRLFNDFTQVLGLKWFRNAKLIFKRSKKVQ